MAQSKSKSKATEETKEADLAKIEGPGAELAVVQAEAAQILAPIRENLQGEQITERDLDRIKIPTGGMTQWLVPSIDGEEETAKVVEGVIVYTKIVRAFWRESYEDSGGGTPPDCRSTDGIHGVGDPGGLCETCAMNQWPDDDAKENRKPCKEMRLLFMVREEDVLPSVVVLPPTSLQPFKRFLLRLASRGIPYHGIMAQLKLEKVQSAGGVDYARVVPSSAGRLSPAVHERIQAYADTLAEVFQSAGVEAGDVEGAA